MLDGIFREYDIRGIVGQELVIEKAYALGLALAAFFMQQTDQDTDQVRTIVVGMDGRTHSPAFAQEICRALLDSGITVIFIGLCPTPVMYFSLYQLPVKGGVMITASHNGPAYNGMKICLGKQSVWGAQLRELRELYKQGAGYISAIRGEYREYTMIDSYVTWLTEHFPHLKGMDLRVLIDCGNGATGMVMPALIAAMDWPAVQLLYATIDGSFPHHQPDPTVEEHMHDLKKSIIDEGYDVGIGFDGDGDRMASLTCKGELIAGDMLLAVFSKQIIAEHPGAAVVFDGKCSQVLSDLLKAWGAQFHIVPTGHPNIKEAVKKHKALLGGELSCHFFFNDRYFGYDDGIYAALRLLEIIYTLGESLHNLISSLPRTYTTPELRVPCQETLKITIVQHAHDVFAARHDSVVIELDGIRAVLPYGWGIIRASHTQSVISIRCESSTREGLEHIKKDFYSVLVPYCDTALLQTIFKL